MTITFLDTYTVSPTQTPSASATPSTTASNTALPTASSSATASHTPGATTTSTPTQSLTLSPTPYYSPTPSPTASPYVSPTISPTRSIDFYQQPELVKERGIYPNPFVQTAHIYFNLRVAATVKLYIYNVAGEIIFIQDYPLASGRQQIVWDGINEIGGRGASGVYSLHLKAEGVDRSSGGYWTQVVIQR